MSRVGFRFLFQAWERGASMPSGVLAVCPLGGQRAMAFNERLKELREAAGMTQEALARAAGLRVSTVSKLEQKGVDPNWSTVQKLADALGVGVEAFAGGDEPPPPAGKKKGKGKK